ncbi:hypothetical protein MLD38_005198 [Melastoma candidum]|uniref:Uncharacterized protein n=1 Tax=Melastoma candidum TaxID=119954 RepID=A0ACB9S7L7_9MYRT|nr:hypothetical protein MLD38_005198 [Melastoma candidum]
MDLGMRKEDGRGKNVNICDGVCGDGRGKVEGNGGKVIVAAATAAGCEIRNGALVWALTHVVHPGDSITLLVVAADNSSMPRGSSFSSGSGRKFWAFPKFAGGCARDDRETCSRSVGDWRKDIADAYSRMILRLHDLYDSDKINIKIRIVPGTPTGMVAREAKKARATWVVLDKHLKCEEKHCIEELQCNIVAVKGSQPKVLRLNLLGQTKEEISQQASMGSPVDPNRLPGKCRNITTTTPRSSPELGEWFTATEAGTSPASSSDKCTSSSPSLLSKIIEDMKMVELPSICESMNHEPCDSESEGEIQTSSSRGLRFEPWTTSSFIEEVLHAPSDEFLKIIGPGKSKYGSAAALLCSICKHEAPEFGKPPRGFTFSELQHATNGFSQANFLAEGGFGSVHRGVLPDGQVIAVKQHKSASSQGDREFCAEVDILSRTRHRNVIMLIGFCIEGARRLLVYEYVCNGSLDSHLYGNHRNPLSWHSRKKIATGAARGLRYLHEECMVGCIIHRDMRPNNILVTHDFEPLVGDFGLARWQPDEETGIETHVLGTFGYLAPEYAQTGQITEKADVYSFGVILLELVTGRKAVDLHRPKGQQCLVEWARPLVEQSMIEELIDPRLGDQYPEHEVLCMTHTALKCVRQDPESRPRMSQVLRILKGIGGALVK